MGDADNTMDDAKSFLDDHDLRPVKLQGSCPFNSCGLALGAGNSPLEVVIVTHSSVPNIPTLRSTWKHRKGNRASPLLLVVLYVDKAALCGPTGDDAPAYVDLDPGQVKRICLEALSQPNRHAALRALRDSLPALDSELAGIRNEGFLATHELKTGARQRNDWQEAVKKASGILDKRGENLLSALGYQIEQCDRVTSILRAGKRKVGIAVLLTETEYPDIQTERFSDLSPITYALSIADNENIPYVILQHGPKVRIYPTKLGVGVGRRGRTETYIECHTGLLSDQNAAYLWLLFSAEALSEGGSLDELIDASGRFSGDLAEKLRERIYSSVIPLLAEGIVKARNLKKPSAQDLDETFQMAMHVLFRLLFIAYGEDKDLLPYRWNGLYRRRSLKTKAQEILELIQNNLSFGESNDYWDEINRLFKAVEVGNNEWGVPAYDGGLFSTDPEISRIGALLSKVELPNTIFGPALRDLLLLETGEGLGPVDFRSLGVREFGTVYEGLLESELSVAEIDLTIDREGIYKPAGERDDVLVSKGDIYLHNASGARKSSGSYFTKHFAVEHLIERSLEVALQDHLARLDKLDDEAAGKNFFDFRVADIAMGSGHFLISAIDHIERSLSNYLVTRKLPFVADELLSLCSAAEDSLGSLADQIEIEDTQLLRRLIARRCIYGVDINSTAVQLSRLAIWIHTFVPGLPLSLLDHNIVQGNSLVGIGQLSEIRDMAEVGSLPLFPIDASYFLGEASEHLGKLARITDASMADVQRSRKAMFDASKAIEPALALCDIVTACRIDGSELPFEINDWDEIKDKITGSNDHIKALDTISDLDPLNFPIAFPEVFLRERSGFLM